jgi:Ca2+-binding RTX toxin-like protein
VKHAGVAGLVVAAGLFLAASASGTFQPSVTYAPPDIVFEDLYEHISAEDAEIGKAGNQYTFTSSTTPATTTSPECAFIAGGVQCPVAGIERIIVRLGDLADRAHIDLETKANKVRQILKGGDQGDTVKGGPGRQRILGQNGGDTLRGGRGDDFIDGGPGNDQCSGGAGHDTVIDCEG